MMMLRLLQSIFISLSICWMVNSGFKIISFLTRCDIINIIRFGLFNRKIKMNGKVSKKDELEEFNFGGLTIHKLEEEYIQVFALKIEYLEEGPGPAPGPSAPSPR